MSENKVYNEIIGLKTNEIELLKRLNEGMSENIKIHTEYIGTLESKLCYVKDFVFKNLPHSLEQLKIK